MSVPLWVWAVTLVGIGALVAFDLRHIRSPHEVKFREALRWTLIYILAAVVFGVVIGVSAGAHHATEFFAGYLVEESLSVDNLFVFAVILGRFAIPSRHRQRVLLIGIVGALVLRAAFIAVGAALIARLAFTFVIFGVFLIYTAIQLIRTHGETSEDVGETRAVRLLQRFMPVTSESPDGALIVKQNGRRAATPLLVATVAILSVDIFFAMDSIPAIFGITHTPYLVFTANAFALLGLRAMYFLVVGLLDRLVHLHYGLAVVLSFIGVKLVLHYFHTVNDNVPEISTGVSLGVVATVLAATTLTSLRTTRKSSAVSVSRSASGSSRYSPSAPAE